MTNRPKQIVIDKDVFITLSGRQFDILRDFCRQRCVLLSDTLLYECATAGKQNPKVLLQKYEELVKSGAYYCSMSLTFVEWECRQCQPYPWLLPDLGATKQIQTGERRPADLLRSSGYRELSQQRYKVAKAFLNSSKKVKNGIDVEDPSVGQKIRQLPSDRYERFRILLEFVDSSTIHESGIESVPHDWIRDEEQFCLSPDWMSWQRIRLTDVLANNYHYLRRTGDPPGAEGAEHDCQDLEYVMLLSRADAIITRDKKLVEPLARAAFPKKDVFSSLDEVPASYRCDWVGS